MRHFGLFENLVLLLPILHIQTYFITIDNYSI